MNQKKIYANITALGMYVPENILTNADLEKMVETTDEWIVSRTGIKERRIVAKGETTSDLCTKAMGKALSADSIATITGSLVGSSTVTSYIESAAGVREGGRTGLTAVTVGVLFILALLLAPVIGLVPRFATAPALLFVAVLMVRGLTEIDWEDVTEYAPAVLAAVVMPFTFSIAHGIAFGFIVYAAGKILTGRMSEASPILYIMAVLFVLLYGFGLIG